MAESTASSETRDDERSPLKRVMGPKLLLLFIVGDVLGAGVYAVTGDMFAEDPSCVYEPAVHGG